MQNKNSGFTLVELAIVIVIIGLLVGGVLQGQELIKASQRNSAFAAMKNYGAATILFKDKYGGLPGDMLNATRFFGQATCDGTHKMVTGGTGTCDAGNQDGVILSQASYWAEAPLFWNQLGLSKMIKGSFSGTFPGLTSYYVQRADNDSPLSPIKGNIYYPKVVHYSHAVYSVPANTKNHIGLTGYADTREGNISVDDAMAFEQKFDDGTPATGNIVVVNSESTIATGCVDSDFRSSTTGNFLSLATATNTCRILYYY